MTTQLDRPQVWDRTTERKVTIAVGTTPEWDAWVEDANPDTPAPRRAEQSVADTLRQLASHLDDTGQTLTSIALHAYRGDALYEIEAVVVPRDESEFE